MTERKEMSVKNLKYFPYERNQYFYGKLLSVEDFQSEQKYMNDKRRLINRFLHGCGVVCGLNVVQVDDCTLSLEPGLALDFAGREIMVDTPVTRKLSMIKGFDSYTEEDENSSYLYLCIEYAEKDKDPVYNVAGSASGRADFNRIEEGFQIYLSSHEPEEDNITSGINFERKKTVYWGNGIRINQVFPGYVKGGEEFSFRVVVENMGQKLPICFSYELTLECLEFEGKDQIKVEFDEENFEKARRYVFSYILKAEEAAKRKGWARLVQGSFQFRVGGHELELKADCASEVIIVKEDIEDVLNERYHQKAMEEILKDAYHQSIYLAKISVIQAGSTFVIDGIEPMPFHQYVYNQVLASVIDRILRGRIEQMERHLGSWIRKNLDTKQPKQEGFFDTAQTAAGSAAINLGIGGMAGQKFFTEEITHGLGLGSVRIILGEAYGVKEDSYVVYGAGDIFDETIHTLRAELAARVEVTKGTFVIGLRLLETTAAKQIKVHWMALKDRKELVYDREERELFVKPDMIYLRQRETYYFEAVFTGAPDQRVNWRIKEAGGGSIDKNGMYTSPNTPGIFEIIAESAAYPELTASAFVVVKE